MYVYTCVKTSISYKFVHPNLVIHHLRGYFESRRVLGMKINICNEEKDNGTHFSITTLQIERSGNLNLYQVCAGSINLPFLKGKRRSFETNDIRLENRLKMPQLRL